MIVDAIIKLYVEHYVPSLVNARSIERLFVNHFSPLCSYQLEGLSRFDVQRWYRAIGQQHPQAANECLSRLRHVINWAARELDLTVSQNPASHIKHFPHPARTRFLTRTEVCQLLTILEQHPPLIRLYFRLILLTAARRGEALTLCWADVHDKVWEKSHTKTGVPHCIPLCPSLWHGLEQARQGLSLPSGWVFTGKQGRWSIAYIERRWQTIRCEAGIPDVRIHDLRRSTASLLAMLGENLSVIQAILGHQNLRHTAIYARLSHEPVERALHHLDESFIKWSTIPHESHLP